MKIIGTKGNDLLDGAPYDDRLFGYRGADKIDGGNGNDVIYGGRGNDVLIGGTEGDDVLFGGRGRDDMIGGPGNDVLIGGRGADNFNFLVYDVPAPRSVHGVDRVVDFKPGKDTITINVLDDPFSPDIDISTSYDDDTGFLYVAVNGTNVLVAQLPTDLVLSKADLIIA